MRRWKAKGKEGWGQLKGCGKSAKLRFHLVVANLRRKVVGRADGRPCKLLGIFQDAHNAKVAQFDDIVPSEEDVLANGGFVKWFGCAWKSARHAIKLN